MASSSDQGISDLILLWLKLELVDPAGSVINHLGCSSEGEKNPVTSRDYFLFLKVSYPRYMKHIHNQRKIMSRLWNNHAANPAS
jgi:hypothetical protein